MKITKKSIYTNVVNTMEVDITEALYNQWKAGENIDEHLSYDEQEFLRTGATLDELDEFDDDSGFEGTDPGPYDWEW